MSSIIKEGGEIEAQQQEQEDDIIAKSSGNHLENKTSSINPENVTQFTETAASSINGNEESPQNKEINELNSSSSSINPVEVIDKVELNQLQAIPSPDITQVSSVYDQNQSIIQSSPSSKKENFLNQITSEFQPSSEENDNLDNSISNPINEQENELPIEINKKEDDGKKEKEEVEAIEVENKIDEIDYDEIQRIIAKSSVEKEDKSKYIQFQEIQEKSINNEPQSQIPIQPSEIIDPEIQIEKDQPIINISESLKQEKEQFNEVDNYFKEEKIEDQENKKDCIELEQKDNEILEENIIINKKRSISESLGANHPSSIIAEGKEEEQIQNQEKDQSIEPPISKILKGDDQSSQQL